MQSADSPRLSRNERANLKIGRSFPQYLMEIGGGFPGASALLEARGKFPTRHARILRLLPLVAGMPLVAEIISERPVHDRSWKMVNL